TTITVAYNSIVNTSTAATANVNVAGPVTSIKIVVSNTQVGKASDDDGSFWLSDIAACVTSNSFPTAYGAISKPYTGQPGYILTARDNEVYMVDPATGTAKFLFADPTLKNINSMGYDPYNKILYYTYSLTALDGQGKAAVNPNNKTINKYDFKTETYSTFVADVTTIGIPVFGSGVESGGASYYDGALYLGIEGSSATGSTDESIIWRIDMDASGNAISATQVFGLPTPSHDWGDYVITDGILYDFDGKADLQNIYHFNLQSAALTEYSVSPDTVHQVAVDWSGQVYNIGAISTTNAKGEVMPYQYNGKFKSSAIKPILVNGVAIAGSWGDAASAFKPKSDFGDAPSTYDPDPLAPAMHDTSTNLRIGPNESIQWDKPTTASLGTQANTDTYDDGLPYVRILVSSGNNYQTDVNVFNNTSTNATLIAWIDFNKNGVFESNEGSTVQTVLPSTTMQSKSLFWPSITSTLAPNSYSYLRIRITSAANGMTSANATGWFSDGEVEDYYLPVNTTILAVGLSSFSAKKTSSGNVAVNWNTIGEDANTVYEVERSADGNTWTTINRQTAAANTLQYSFTDTHPVQPVSYYRLKYGTTPRNIQYSRTEKLTFSNPHVFQVYPNPAISKVMVTLTAATRGMATLALKDLSGRTVFANMTQVEKGKNTFTIPVLASMPAGAYTFVLTLSDAVYTEKVLIRKT
ncbi:MAG TPA: GEVED domain-containing protein, partial [Niastella sp.]|nr:GEVED domain-containing protein [Niastella sp.]